MFTLHQNESATPVQEKQTYPICKSILKNFVKITIPNRFAFEMALKCVPMLGIFQSACMGFDRTIPANA